MGALRAAVGLALFAALAAGAALQPPRELWGYVQVRSKAHIFWWLYYADSRTAGFAELPLILWLQGGPGSSGCGFGNFEEIGPLDKELKPRNTTWLQAASILFVDNPVGTGFSYVDDCSLFAKNLTTVVSDMMVFLNEFFTHRTEFQNVPFYIFSESYGGKMAAGIALELHKAVQEGSIKCNFAGVALGDSWISPLDSVLSWGPYLYSTSLLDDHGLAEVTAVAKEIMDAINKNEYGLATELWSKAEGIIEENTDNVNFYNIMTKEVPEMKATEQENFHLVRLYQRHVEVMHKNNLSELMNGPIRKKLKVIPDCVKWGGQSTKVFENMAEDFMRPVIDIVDQLLAANVSVTVYNGQLDLIVDTMGQEAWIRKLKWPGLKAFSQQRWKALYVSPESTDTAAFYKAHENFAFFWILKAGHMVPSDQGEMALKMVRMVTQQKH
ncbi:retinoid-inducible serine carboxypeptidase [Lagopus muta]|uniref:retinoid-inducible serine carboxypeptidase n=1 Tax=Lagopus muta TaxID=64668 RepID=UPI0020A1F690|nr:retinoid-inducible serine carboxypeptidase [Lagopus muta]